MGNPEVRIYDAEDDASLEELKRDVREAMSRLEEEEAARDDIGQERPAGIGSECDVDFSSDLAEEPLDLPDVAQAVDAICAEAIYDRDEVENAIVSLAADNLLLSGPPGTGKTRLARELAGVFNVRHLVETANPEWSVYDVIGSKTLTEDGHAVPNHGIVTRAILECYDAISAQAEQEDAPQAVWLVIDELNRAQIDRAFGPLFTALADRADAQYTLDYCSNTPALRIPARFRIIATINSFDTRFVNTMSAALRRRFARALVLPLPNDDGLIRARELEIALDQAESRAQSLIGETRAAEAREFLARYESTIRAVFAGFREPTNENAKRVGEGVPIGTAHIIDCCVFAMLLHDARVAPASPNGEDETSGEGEPEFMRFLDRTLAARLSSGLESDNLRRRIGKEFVHWLESRFPQLEATAERFRAFLGGRD